MGLLLPWVGKTVLPPEVSPGLGHRDARPRYPAQLSLTAS